MASPKTSEAALLIRELFDRVVGLGDEDRVRILDRECGDQPDVRHELDGLLEAYDRESETLFTNPATARHLEGEEVGHYRVGRKLGGGGMGVVYEAHDIRLLRDVALKFLPQSWSSNESAKTRFLQEARLASAIDHPNICTVYEVDETEDGQLFIAMARYSGRTLKQAVAEGAVDAATVRDVAIQVARGLTKAHEVGIVHRDIKPANLMMTEDGAVKILDFGIAKIADVTLTAPSLRVGTIPYMSPEQIRGEPVDGRTDIWSLGVTLYEMVTGQRPFDHSYDLAAMYSILNEDPVTLANAPYDVPSDLAQIIRRCLAKEPSERYQSAKELLMDLCQEAAPSSRSTRRVSDRAKLAIPIAAVVVVALLAALWLKLVPPYEPPVPPEVDVAVLPLENVGADPELVDGFAYAISSGLTSMARHQGRISVVPYSEVSTDGVSSASGAARAYGVSHAVAGRVQATDVGYVVTLDLIDASTGRNVDSRQLLVPAGSVLPFASAVNGVLADLFGVDVAQRLPDQMDEGRTNVDAAYDFYLRAQGHLQVLETDVDVEIAIGLLQAAVEEDPGFALASAALGQAYLRRYSRTGSRIDMDKALQAGERAAALRPDLPDTRATLGEIYLGTGQLDAAESELLQAMRVDSLSARIHHALADVYKQRGDLQESERLYIAATKLEPKNWQYHNSLGKFYHAIGAHEKALGPFAEVIALRPTNPKGYNNLGAQYHQLGRLDEAAMWYERAREVNPAATAAVAHATRNAAGVHYLNGDYERSAALYEQAVKIDPHSLEGWENLGNAYHWLGRADEARRVWTKVVELAEELLAVNPVNSHALEYLCETYAKLGESAAARKAVDRLLAMGHVEMSALINIVKTFEIMGDRDTAMVYAEKAVLEGAKPSAFEASVWLDELRLDPAYSRILLRRAEG